MKRSRKDSATLQLIRSGSETHIDFDFVVEEAGERPMSLAKRALHQQVRNARGQRFYADLLFALVHQSYGASEAESLWYDLLKHRDRLEAQLGRRVGVAVAAVDLLSNIRRRLERPTLVPEADLAETTKAATHDPLTGLWDRGTFQVFIEHEMRRAQRTRQPMSLIMIDVDQFKAYNDTNGHPAGDRALQKLATVLGDEIRGIDLLSRYGGEEFALVAPATSKLQAVQLAQRIRRRFRRSFAREGLTVSLGVASLADDANSVRSLIQAADEALYHSKHTGRDRVSAFDPRWEMESDTQVTRKDTTPPDKSGHYVRAGRAKADKLDQATG